MTRTPKWPCWLVAIVVGGCTGRHATVDLSVAVVGAPSPRLAPRAAAAATGTNVAAVGGGLAQLELFVDTIVVCEDVTLAGTATMGGTGCKTLYQGPDNATLHDTSNLAAALDAAAAITDGYVDVMDATSRAKLERSISLDAGDARSYRYGIISWAPPIKVTATLVDPADGTTPMLYTRAGAPAGCSVNDIPYTCELAAHPLTEGPAEQAILGGGGTVVFAFQQPFVVTADDITNEASFQITLAFDPNGLVQGVLSPGATNFPPLADGVVAAGIPPGRNVGNTIAFVGAQLAPIFSKTSSQVVRESYTAVLPTSDGAGTFALRVELYYLADDAARAIYGVTTATIPTAATTGYLVGFPSAYGVTTNADGTVTFTDDAGQPLVAGFGRVTAGTTTGDVRCDPVTTTCTPGTPVHATFTLDAIAPL